MLETSNYPSNSNASRIKKTEEIGQVAIPEGREVKKPLGNRLLSSLFADDISNIKEYVIWDVLLPAFKNAIVDTVSNGIEMLFYGEPRSGKRRDGNGRMFNYSGIYSGSLSSSRVIRLNDRDDREPRHSSVRGGVAGYSYQEIALSRAEAEDVLWRLRQKESQYGMTSVSDMYDAIAEVLGQDPFKDVREFTDNKWGWFDVDKARLERVSNGYIIRMPRLEAL